MMKPNIKRLVLERDNHTCQICGFHGSSHELRCHHIHYKDAGNPDTCLTLCSRCHTFISLLQYGQIWHICDKFPFHILKSITFSETAKGKTVSYEFKDNVNLENFVKASTWGLKATKKVER